MLSRFKLNLALERLKSADDQPKPGVPDGSTMAPGGTPATPKQKQPVQPPPIQVNSAPVATRPPIAAPAPQPVPTPPVKATPPLAQPTPAVQHTPQPAPAPQPAPGFDVSKLFMPADGTPESFGKWLGGHPLGQMLTKGLGYAGPAALPLLGLVRALTSGDSKLQGHYQNLIDAFTKKSGRALTKTAFGVASPFSLSRASGANNPSAAPVTPATPNLAHLPFHPDRLNVDPTSLLGLPGHGVSSFGPGLGTNALSRYTPALEAAADAVPVFGHARRAIEEIPQVASAIGQGAGWTARQIPGVGRAAAYAGQMPLLGRTLKVLPSVGRGAAGVAAGALKLPFSPLSPVVNAPFEFADIWSQGYNPYDPSSRQGLTGFAQQLGTGDLKGMGNQLSRGYRLEDEPGITGIRERPNYQPEPGQAPGTDPGRYEPVVGTVPGFRSSVTPTGGAMDWLGSSYNAWSNLGRSVPLTVKDWWNMAGPANAAARSAVNGGGNHIKDLRESSHLGDIYGTSEVNNYLGQLRRNKLQQDLVDQDQYGNLPLSPGQRADIDNWNRQPKPNWLTPAREFGNALLGR